MYLTYIVYNINWTITAWIQQKYIYHLTDNKYIQINFVALKQS